VRGFLSVLALGCLVACAQQPRKAPEPPPQAAPATRPAPSGPELVSGLGEHHHPIATSSEGAQAFFDQGFAWVFAFNHEEAVRSFTRAAELDPNAAMPHWGVAWALGPNYNSDVDDPREKQAYQEIQVAKRLAASGPPEERAYVAAMATRFSANSKADRTKLARTYSAAMRDLSRRYPDDLDAATLYAESLMNLNPWKLWTLDGKPAPDTEEIVRVLESVLRRDPHHVGANHYYIHSVEASRHPERALPSAQRLGRLAPAAGHLVHMPAHIYARTGDHAAATRANEEAVEVDRSYLADAPPDAYYGLAYYSHNLQFLAYDHMMQGRFEDAEQAAGELAERLGPHVGMMPMMESLIVAPTSVLLRFGRYADVLQLSEPPAERPVERAWFRYARGVAFAQQRDAASARAERAQLTAAIRPVPASALFGGGGFASARTVLGLAATTLDARIAWASGDFPGSIRLWRKAVAAADQLPYDEPPVWLFPVRESLGAALLLRGRAEEAERVFRADLERHPRNARSLFGLRESLARQGRSADAAWVGREFEAAWQNADPDLELSLEML
jgi:tetratricopeptide (TPR) repeat protein